MTKREMFTNAIAILSTIEGINEDIVKGLEHEIEILDNRKSAKSGEPSKRAKENQPLKDEILRVLREGGVPMTITEIKDASAILGKFDGSQKISSLLTQMGDKGTKQVVKSYDKKVAYFALAEGEDE